MQQEASRGAVRRAVYAAVGLALVLGFTDCVASISNGGFSAAVPAFALLTLCVLAFGATDLRAQQRALEPAPGVTGAAFLSLVPAWIAGSFAALESWLRGAACCDGVCTGPSTSGGLGIAGGFLAALLLSFAVARVPRVAPPGPAAFRSHSAARVARGVGVIALVGSAAVLVASSVASLRAPSPDAWYARLPVVHRWASNEVGPGSRHVFERGLSVERSEADGGAAMLTFRDEDEHTRWVIYGHRESTVTREVRFDARGFVFVARDPENGVRFFFSREQHDHRISEAGSLLRAHLRAGTLSAPRGWLLLGLEGPLFALLVYLSTRRRIATLRAAPWVHVTPESLPALDPAVGRELPHGQPCWVVLDPPTSVPLRGSQRIERVVLFDPVEHAGALERDAWLAVFGASLLTSAPLAVVLYLSRFG